MDVGLAVAGGLCALLGLGHATLGVVWVLPSVTADKLPKTPFGPSSMTASMLHASWHIITVFVWSLATLLLILAWDADADVKTVLLRVFAVMWVGAALVATLPTIRRVRSLRKLMRLPVPILFVVVAVLLWIAST